MPEDDEEDEDDEELELEVVEDDEDEEEVANPEELDDEPELLSPELLAALEDEPEFDPSLKSSEPQALISTAANSKTKARSTSEFVITVFAIIQLPAHILRPLFLAHEVLHALVPDYFVFQPVYAKDCTHLWREDKNKAIIHGWRGIKHNLRQLAFNCRGGALFF